MQLGKHEFSVNQPLAGLSVPVQKSTRESDVSPKAKYVCFCSSDIVCVPSDWSEVMIHYTRFFPGSIKRLLAFHALQSELQRIRTSHLLFRRRKRRRWHVRPIFQMRKQMGAWYTIIPIMREEDPDEFFNFMRMTPESFDWLWEEYLLSSKRSLFVNL